MEGKKESMRILNSILVNTRVSAFQADVLTSEPPGKLKTQNFRTERTLEWVKGRVDIIDYIT